MSSKILISTCVSRYRLGATARTFSAAVWSRAWLSPGESDFIAGREARKIHLTETTIKTSTTVLSPEAARTKSHVQDDDWSRELSFSSPESDFSAAWPKERKDLPISRSNREADWSHELSFSSPESDFSAAWPKERKDRPTSRSNQEDEWSHELSFSSPESDFSAAWPKESLNQPATRYNREDEWSHEMSFSSPESDFSATWAKESGVVDEAVTAKPNVLPRSVQEIHDDPRAIVVTESKEPFEIVHVNDAWVDLCGYSRDECRYHSLGTLLQGPDTNEGDLKNFMTQLLQQDEAWVELTNYNKAGRKFRNRVHAGAIRDEHDRVTHFVGILEDLGAQK